MRGDTNLTNAAEFETEQDHVFARIAHRYDFLCDIFSFGIHRLWKRLMSKRMANESAAVVLDVASGTGDIPYRYFSDRLKEIPGEFWVTDICPEMLELAKTKLDGVHESVRFAEANAYNLSSFEDNSIDLFAISFAMKICDRAKVLEEAMRVLRPGGVFYCLEASRIKFDVIHRLYLKYMDWCMPVIGKIASGGDSSAYLYLLKGVHNFPDQITFADELKECGFEQVSYETLSLGIAAIHRAQKPT